MSTIEERFYSLGYLDDLSREDSPVHRLDARIKIILTVAFIVLVTSHGRYDLSGLLPFAAFPVLLGAAAGLPSGYILKALLVRHIPIKSTVARVKPNTFIF